MVIVTLKTDAGCQEVIDLGSLSSAYALAVQGGYGYVSDWNTGAIYLANLETGKLSQFVSGFVRPSQFAIHSENLQGK